jgi:hypothetical protein
VVGAFETRAMAGRAVNDLMGAGFRPDQLSVLGRHGELTDVTPEGETATKVATGAGIGAAVGGLGSILLGAAALAIPGVGPVLAAGSWAGALSLALGGGLVGFLSAQGVPADQAELYAERVCRSRRGFGVQCAGAAVRAGRRRRRGRSRARS